MTQALSPEKCATARAEGLKALRRQLQELRRGLPALAREDPDAIHDVRVASRRLRAILSEGRRAFDPRHAQEFREQARRITRDLGRARELDVTCDVLQGLRRALHGPPRHAANHLLRRLTALRRDESSRIQGTAAWLRSREFTSAAQTLARDSAPSPKCWAAMARKRTVRRYRETVRAFEAWRKGPSDAALHGIRIAFKKLRYACEFYRPAYGRKMDAFIRGLKGAQQALGDWHDWCVLKGYIEAHTSTAPARAAEGMPELRRVVRHELGALLAGFVKPADAVLAKARMKPTLAFLREPSVKCCRERAPAAPACPNEEKNDEQNSPDSLARPAAPGVDRLRR